MEEFPKIAEEEEEELEEEEEEWHLKARLEVVEYLIRRFGNLRARDIAGILGCGDREVRPLLKRLERSGRVERLKLGRDFVWTPTEHRPELMYY